MNKLHISDDAQNDLAKIKQYITEELGNPTATLSTMRKITADIRALKQHALLGLDCPQLRQCLTVTAFL
ncbi:hypothetical protein [Colidextribacter sp. OB.20]|uniref:type II toxin-antitoxin system RelE/ParE family toxin n=1 Tax=Colidextribacter sp. OB.20 TaxID=2304568 RepID=UPI001FABC40C|nr:hypothetical protein [Colidextribacter sp. OB.20]